MGARNLKPVHYRNRGSQNLENEPKELDQQRNAEAGTVWNHKTGPKKDAGSLEPMIDLPCSTEIREMDQATKIRFLDCSIDYTQCPYERCIKKLV